MSNRERKQREHEQRREDILNAMQRLIASEGYENVRMQDVADAVEISKGSLYLNFKDKDDIVSALVLRSFDALDRIIAEEMAIAGTATEKLERLGNAYWRFLAEKPEIFPNFSLISRLATNAKKHSESNGIANRLKNLESLLKRTIQEGIEEGSIRSSINPPLLVALIPVLVNSFMEKLAELPRKAGPILGYGPQELIKEFFDILLFYMQGA